MFIYVNLPKYVPAVQHARFVNDNRVVAVKAPAPKVVKVDHNWMFETSLRQAIVEMRGNNVVDVKAQFNALFTEVK